MTIPFYKLENDLGKICCLHFLNEDFYSNFSSEQTEKGISLFLIHQSHVNSQSVKEWGMFYCIIDIRTMTGLVYEPYVPFVFLILFSSQIWLQDLHLLLATPLFLLQFLHIHFRSDWLPMIGARQPSVLDYWSLLTAAYPTRERSKHD